MIQLLLYYNLLFVNAVLLLPTVEAYCRWRDPSINKAPLVEKVSNEVVLVSWEKKSVGNLDCAENFGVKWWPENDPNGYKISYPYLPTTTFQYEVTGLVPNKQYGFQVMLVTTGLFCF